MSEETYIPFADIVVELKRLCDTGKTGVLFIATRKNKSAQIMLSNGAIVFIYFFNKRGKDALSLMLEIQAGRFKFQEGAITARPMDLPPTSEIIQYLMNGTGISDTSSVQATQTVPPQQQNSDGPALSSLVRQQLEDALAKYIGPMAAIICEDHLGSARDVLTAIESLASEIPGEELANQFRTEAKQKLGV